MRSRPRMRLTCRRNPTFTVVATLFFSRRFGASSGCGSPRSNLTPSPPNHHSVDSLAYLSAMEFICCRILNSGLNFVASSREKARSSPSTYILALSKSILYVTGSAYVPSLILSLTVHLMADSPTISGTVILYSGSARAFLSCARQNAAKTIAAMHALRMLTSSHERTAARTTLSIRDIMPSWATLSR
jgi:hypothetical protein